MSVYISNVVTIYLNMFGALMVKWISSNLNSTSIISMERSRFSLRKSKLRQ